MGHRGLNLMSNHITPCYQLVLLTLKKTFCRGSQTYRISEAFDSSEKRPNRNCLLKSFVVSHHWYHWICGVDWKRGKITLKKYIRLRIKHQQVNYNFYICYQKFMEHSVTSKWNLRTCFYFFTLSVSQKIQYWFLSNHRFSSSQSCCVWRSGSVANPLRSVFPDDCGEPSGELTLQLHITDQASWLLWMPGIREGKQKTAAFWTSLRSLRLPVFKKKGKPGKSSNWRPWYWCAFFRVGLIWYPYHPSDGMIYLHLLDFDGRSRWMLWRSRFLVERKHTVDRRNPLPVDIEHIPCFKGFHM